MIKSKQDLQFYLDADKFSLNRKGDKPSWHDGIWRFQILLRKVEYYSNSDKTFFNKAALVFYKIRKHRLGLSLGFDIPPNVFGAGLRINHFGNIVVNNDAKVGMWCDIHQGVNIGSNNSESGEPLVPTIGANVWIGPGVKIFGRISIGDEVQIGANAVVSRDALNQTTLAGVPAKVVSNKGTNGVSVAASKKRMQLFISARPEYKSYFELPDT